MERPRALHYSMAEANGQIRNAFYKNHKSDVIFWVDNKDTIGEHLFTFDKVKIYNLFADYPHNLTPEENTRRIRIFLHFT